MGPLAKVWFRVEKVIAYPSSQLDIQEWIGYVVQSVLLTCQAYNAISYNRRLNVLTATGAEKAQAKSSLKDQSKLIESQSKKLFGKSFRKHIRDTAKARKESKEYTTNHNNGRRMITSQHKQQQTTLSEELLILEAKWGVFRRICFNK